VVEIIFGEPYGVGMSLPLSAIASLREDRHRAGTPAEVEDLPSLVGVRVLVVDDTPSVLKSSPGSEAERRRRDGDRHR
jgi:hypothetical protein